MRNSSMAIVLFLSASFSISAQHREATNSLNKELQEVLVTARQPATKLIGNTFVSTIVGSNLQNIGTALDVLAQLSMIKVDGNSISIVGKGAPEIFIDGRPMRSDQELIQLQSTNIKKVELLMAPGAMYSSDTNAVLKITTRRNFVDGLSLLDRGEVVARRKWSANNMLDLNYRTGKWDIFMSGIIARNNSLIKGSTTNTLIFDNKETTIGSSQHKNYPSDNGVIKAGVNYSSGNQSFGGYYRYNPERGHFSNAGDEWIDDQPVIKRNIHSGIRAHSHSASAYYDNTFCGKYLLHFDVDYKNSRSYNNVLTSYPDNDAGDINSDECRKSYIWAGKLYLSLPVAKGNFTIGTQDSHTHTTLRYNMHNPEISGYIPSSLSDVRQTSLAAFASWSRTFGKLSISTGLRYEYIDHQFMVDGNVDKDVSRTDNLLTPDISLGYTFNDDTQLNLSYRMATVKPPYSHMSGSLNYVGMHEIEGGNPALRDEHMHNIQLFGMWNGFMLQANYTRSIDTYAFVKRIYPAPTLQLLMQPINIDVSAMDIYIVWNKNIGIWSPNITGGIHRQWLKLNDTSYNRPILSYYFDNMFSLPKGFLLTLNAYGNTKGDMHTNRFGSTWFALDASISKSFLDKALQVKFSATDILNTRNNNWTMNTYGIHVDKRQTYDHRGVSLTLTYRFQPRQSKYKGKPASESEMKRL